MQTRALKDNEETSPDSSVAAHRRGHNHYKHHAHQERSCRIDVNTFAGNRMFVDARSLGSGSSRSSGSGGCCGLAALAYSTDLLLLQSSSDVMELKIARLTLLVATALAMPPRPSTGASNSEKIDIHEVRCVPRLTVVPLPVEIAAHITFYPDVALVKRCAGACHSGKTCMATKTRIIEIKVWEISILATKSVRSIEVEQHESCRCSCKMQAADCTAKQSYDGCQCKCREPKGQCQPPQVWKEDKCSCECPIEENCDRKGTTFNKEQCKCVTKKRRKKA